MSLVTFDFFNRIINNINIDVLEHGYFTGDETWKFYNVSSPFNRLYFALDGEAYIENDKDRTVFTPGFMYLIPLNSRYSYICNSHMVQFYIHFRVDLFYSFDIFNSLDTCVYLPHDLSQTGIFIKKAESSRIEDIFVCKSILFDAVSRFISRLPDITVQNIDIAFKYRDLNLFLKDHCKAGTSLRNVSEHLNISEATLVKDFKLDTGISLKQHMDSLLIQSAKEKLMLSDLRVKEIAYQLGFSDEFYFSKCFKRHTGFSPKEYRTRNKIVNRIT